MTIVPSEVEFAPCTFFSDGEWRDASGEPFDVVNPATETPLASIAAPDAAQVAETLAAAKRGQPAWGRLPAVVRGRQLRKIADVLDAHREELAQLLVAEVGKPLPQARGEVEWAAAYTRYMAEWDRRVEGEIVPSDEPNESIHLLRVPVGVVVAICAWNYPLAGFFRKLAPALLTGNAVVAKPSPVTPLTSLRAMQLIVEAIELPAGVLNVLVGGTEVAEALVGSPDASLVAMTGSTETGKRIMANAAAHMTRVSLELGGKAPAIVWKDADLASATAALLAARHTNAGQVCTAAERVFVHVDVLKPFVAGYTDAVRALTVGDPRLEATDVGPLVTAEHREKVEAAVAEAVGGGATVAVGGSRPRGDGFARGYWLEPTVLTDVDPSMSVMTDEVFGPVTPIVGVADLDEALALANDSQYGLSAYVFTNDYRTALRVEQELDVGEIYINRTLGEAMQAHHSGHRESGMGGEDGKHGLLRYTQLKSVYHRYG
jgi:lactaldehyde dehydrogenase/glycolaldehyde dehydrogenase